MTAEALGTVYVDQYYASYGNDQTQSAVDLGADYATLNDGGGRLRRGAARQRRRQHRRDPGGPQRRPGLRRTTTTSTSTTSPPGRANVTNTAIDNAAAAVMAAVGPATIHEHHGATWPGAHGISIYFPKTSGSTTPATTAARGSCSSPPPRSGTSGCAPTTPTRGPAPGPTTTSTRQTVTRRTWPTASGRSTTPDPVVTAVRPEEPLGLVPLRHRRTPSPATIDTVGSDYDTGADGESREPHGGLAPRPHDDLVSVQSRCAPHLPGRPTTSRSPATRRWTFNST